MNLDPWTLAAIVGMAGATYATRAAGFLLMRYIIVKGRLRAALDALPAAILMAIIAPTVFTSGVAEAGAGILAASAAMLRFPLIAVVAVGVAGVVVLRAVTT
jgi:uncharacterized membrane protein